MAVVTATYTKSRGGREGLNPLYCVSTWEEWRGNEAGNCLAMTDRFHSLRLTASLMKQKREPTFFD